MKARQTFRHAFTLIELLAVVAIILLLLSVLVPGLKAAKDRAGLVPCQSNLRQLYTLCVNYAGDNNGFLPEGLSENPHMFNMLHPAFDRLDKYMTTYGYPVKIWYCPSQPATWGNEKQWGIDQGGTPGEFPLGYFYIGNTTSNDWNWNNKFHARPPRTLNDLHSTNSSEFIWDFCLAPRPSPIQAAQVPVWSCFPHFGDATPSRCQFMKADGSVTRKSLDEMEQRYSYIAPAEVYW